VQHSMIDAIVCTVCVQSSVSCWCCIEFIELIFQLPALIFTRQVGWNS